VSSLEPWEQQTEINKLLASGFAVLDTKGTEWWKRSAEVRGQHMYHPLYAWTVAGKLACSRWANSTPMSWARAMMEGTERHCISCGRDLYRKPVGAHFTKGPKALKNRCVCMACNEQGVKLEGELE
jgi:hypothetical protein